MASDTPADIAVRKPGCRMPWMDDIEEPFGRELGRTRPDRAAGQGSAGDSDTRRADPRDQVTHPGRGEGGKEGIAAHAGQCDGRNPERGHRGDPLPRFDGQAERPHAAQRGSDDRDPFEVERVEQRRELRNRVLAQRSPRVVKRVAESEPRQVEGDQPVLGELGQQRRPGRRVHAAAVHEQEWRTLASLKHTNSKRWVSQADTSAGDLHPRCLK